MITGASVEIALKVAVQEHLKQVFMLERKLEVLQAELSHCREGLPEIYEKEDRWVVSFLHKDFFDIEKSAGKFLSHYQTQ